MLKKIFITFIVLLLSSFNTLVGYACSVPPDFITTFVLKEEKWDYSIVYKLNTWSIKEASIEKTLLENWYDFSKEEWIEKFVNEKIQEKIKFTDWDWNKLNLKYKSWSLIKYSWWTITWIPFIEMNLDIIEDNLLNSNDIKIKVHYDKQMLSEFSYFSHFEMYSEIEDINWMRNTDYTFQRWNNLFHLQRDILESDEFLWMDFSLTKTTLSNNENADLVEPKQNLVNQIVDLDKVTWNNNIVISNNTNKKDDWYFWLLEWKTIQEFFNEKVNSNWWMFLVIVFSILFWMIHWLLPWHAKSILWAYVLSNNKNRTKDLIILIVTTTLSHSTFIFVIAWIFYLLNKWLWTSSWIILKISAIIYILFWIYFIYSTIRDLWKHKHWENCDCQMHRKQRSLSEQIEIKEESSLKKTILNWILFWCNPCLDALLLFVFFLWTWNLMLSIISVLLFSLWLWLTLWIISLVFMLTQKKFWDNEMFTNISYTIRFILWILILLVWLNWIF